jgi:hypothetical protein
MRKIICFLFFIFFNWLCIAQPINLVPNPSFEIFDTCPYFSDNPSMSGAQVICRATPWFQPHLPNAEPFETCGGSSSDFFHSCAGYIPNILNNDSYQFPYSGEGFVGIGLFFPPYPIEGREYIEVQLNSTLKNKNYCVSWFSNLSEISGIGANRVGAYFSKDSVFQNGSWNQIIVIPQVENLSIIADTENWSSFHQIFIAQGGEKFMTVGNFREAALIDSIIVNPNLLWPYYYFDDFGVYELPEISAGLGGEIDTLGENIPLQANCEGCWNDLVYRWWPSAGLSDTTILNPSATPEVTTTYYFGLIDTSETVPCIVDLVDSVTVFVTIPQDTVTPQPTSFSWLVYPSPTSGNLTLQFSALNNDSQLLIIDARGRLVRKIFVPKNTESLPLDISALAAG